MTSTQSKIIRYTRKHDISSTNHCRAIDNKNKNLRCWNYYRKIAGKLRNILLYFLMTGIRIFFEPKDNENNTYQSSW